MALLALALPWAAPAAAADRYEGLAYAAQGGELVYRETHWRYREQGRYARLVLYRCPDGAPFARKFMRGTQNDIAPTFTFIDARDGYREGVRGQGVRREVYWQEQRGAPPEKHILEFTANAVVDAGFDALIRTRWAELVAGEPVDVAFLIPSRLDFLDFRISKVADKTDAGQDTMHLRMELNAWYGFVFPQTDLVYRTSDQWLLRFEGISTIRDHEGDYQQVRVEFPPRLYDSSVDRAEIDAATTMPLSAGCDG